MGGVSRGQHSAVACTYDLSRVKREARDVAVGLADPFPVVIPANLASDRTCGVFDHRQSMRSRNPDERGKVTRHSHLMNTQNGLGPIRNRDLDQTHVDGVRQGIDINAVGPGPLNTRLLEEVLTAGPERVGQGFYERAMQQKANGGAPLEKGAALCVYMLSAESDGITGRLISAIWDPWRHLDKHAGELANSDIYTLRRIVPRDRGLNWDES